MRPILAIVAVLAAALLTTAHAGPILDKLTTCLSIEDMTKERLDCYDAIVPPEPKAKPPTAKIVTDCRYLKIFEGRGRAPTLLQSLRATAGASFVTVTYSQAQHSSCG